MTTIYKIFKKPEIDVSILPLSSIVMEIMIYVNFDQKHAENKNIGLVSVWIVFSFAAC